jgi:hypothetical protein
MTKSAKRAALGVLLVLVGLFGVVKCIYSARAQFDQELGRGKVKTEGRAPGESQFYGGSLITIGTGSTYTIKLFSEGVCVREWRRAREVRPDYHLAQVTFLDSLGHAAAAYGTFSLEQE